MLIDQVDEDIKSAQKEKNEMALSALRNLKAALMNAQIEKKSDLTDVEAGKVIAKKVKQHKDSIEGFKAGGRQDLVDVETAQMQILEKYLPAQMSEEEIRAMVREVVAAVHANLSDFGKVMKEVVTKIEGRADGTVVSKVVKEELSANSK